MNFPSGSAGKESACNVGDQGLIPGLGRSPGKGNSYPLQYSGLVNSMDGIIHGFTNSRTWLSDFHFQQTYASAYTIYIEFHMNDAFFGLWKCLPTQYLPFMSKLRACPKLKMCFFEAPRKWLIYIKVKAKRFVASITDRWSMFYLNFLMTHNFLDF